MKTSILRPSSMLVGAALAVLVVLVLGAQQVASVTRLFLVSPPTPDQMVHVLSGVTYTVPSGKIFVATGIAPTALTYSTYYLTVRFDGVLVVSFFPVLSPGAGVTSAVTTPVIPAIPPGLSAPAGTAISPLNGTLLGYLANA